MQTLYRLVVKTLFFMIITLSLLRLESNTCDSNDNKVIYYYYKSDTTNIDLDISYCSLNNSITVLHFCRQRKLENLTKVGQRRNLLLTDILLNNTLEKCSCWQLVLQSFGNGGP